MELMQQVELVIWDEAPMTQKYAFEALDKTLWDILGYPVPNKRNKIFGGMMILLGGDFKQILPVIPKGKREDIVQACINCLELWKHCKVSTLKRSMRPARIKDGEDEPTWIEIPETFLIPSLDSPIQHIVEETYPNFIKRQKDDAYLREQAILTPRNDDADAINAYMFDKLASQAITYHSADEETDIQEKEQKENQRQTNPSTEWKEQKQKVMMFPFRKNEPQEDTFHEFISNPLFKVLDDTSNLSNVNPLFEVKDKDVEISLSTFAHYFKEENCFESKGIEFLPFHPPLKFQVAILLSFTITERSFLCMEDAMFFSLSFWCGTDDSNCD
ncbi:ATP-dependent DNA helicase PIF1-like protein [Tanacetum coccineum]